MTNPKAKREKPIHQKVGHGELRPDCPNVIIDVRASGVTLVESCYSVSWAAQVAQECEALLNYWGAECRRYAAICDDKVLIMDDRYGM